PLPLLIDTQPPLPAGAANIPYSVIIAATGGVQPYSFSLASGSNPLPAGLTLTTDVVDREVISGNPVEQGITNNIVIQVRDSQAPPVVSPAVTYSITVNPSTSFVGTSPPGDVWQVVVSHSDATDGILFATDQGTKGLPGTSTSKFTSNFSTVNAGFRQYFQS